MSDREIKNLEAYRDFVSETLTNRLNLLEPMPRWVRTRLEAMREVLDSTISDKKTTELL